MAQVAYMIFCSTVERKPFEEINKHESVIGSDDSSTKNHENQQGGFVPSLINPFIILRLPQLPTALSFSFSFGIIDINSAIVKSIRLEFVTPEDKILWQQPMPLDFKNRPASQLGPGGCIQYVFTVPSLQFSEEGVFKMKLLMDDKILGYAPLVVNKIKRKEM